MTKKQKTFINIDLDAELLEKIDQEAAKAFRTRKAQVIYVLKEVFEE